VAEDQQQEKKKNFVDESVKPMDKLNWVFINSILH